VKLVLLRESDRVGYWVMHHCGGTWVSGQGSGIGLEENGRLVAGCTYQNFNGASVWISAAGERGGRWMTRGFLWTSFAYPFRQLQVRKLLAQVASGNEASRKLVEHLGFRLEATLKDADPSGDVLVYGMTKSQCRWLNIRVPLNGQEFQSAAA
jgi:RimJ/RimL family protein N-acetyltransferase